MKSCTDLKVELTELAKKVFTKYPTVNNGGCCVFASIVGAALEERSIYVRVIAGIDLSFARMQRNVDISEIRNNIMNIDDVYEWGDNGVVFGHVWLEITHNQRKFAFDAEGIERSTTVFRGYRAYKGALTVEDATLLATADYAWNACFNRRYIPKMTKIINSHLLPS